MQLAPGALIDDKFEIVSPIAIGGFGVLYKARQVAFDRMVALKLLNLQTADGSESILRFEREARALSALRHPNIVTVYGFGVWNSSPYITMEYANGETLEAKLNRVKSLSIAESVDFTEQICSALASAHRHGIIHRDLKPSNIMLCAAESGTEVKLIDFGLAKLSWTAAEIQKLTEAGTVVGSAEYMSPEQCTAGKVDTRSDIYAVGCILYRCLAGKPAFTGEPVALMRQHLYETPARLEDYLTSTQQIKDLQLVIDKCMAKAPEDRYQSADELRRDLSAVRRTTHGDLIAQAAKPPKAIAKSDRKRNAIGVMLVCSVLFLGVWMAISKSPESEAIKKSSLAYQREYRELKEQYRMHSEYLENPEIRKRLISLLEKALSANGEDNLLEKANLSHINARLCQLYTYDKQPKVAVEHGELALEQRMQQHLFDVELEADTEYVRDAYEQMGREDEAVKVMERMVANFRERGHHEPLYLCWDLGRHFAKVGNWKKAKEYMAVFDVQNPPGDIAPQANELIDRLKAMSKVK